ncbi:MAG: CARDB domain-containing protein [Solirubrobacterales bacterium]
MEFHDQDDAFEAGDGESAAPLSAEDKRRQYVIRRLVAIGAAILILVLLVLAVRGILDARKTRAFENYVNDLTALVAESDATSQAFFTRLSGSQQGSDLSFEAQIDADRASTETLAARANALDPPDELASANEDIVLAFELRTEGMTVIASEVNNLTADDDQAAQRAIRRITRQMGVFFASDVIYARGRDEATAVLAEENITAEIPPSQFLPNDQNWLDETVVAGAFGEAGGAVPPGSTGVRGLGLGPVSINEVVLVPDAETTVAVGEGNPELTVEVQNQGEAEESDVAVSYTLGGTDGQENISTIAAGESELVTLPINPAPETGVPTTLEVMVDPVPGEEIEANNRATYTVTFQ